MDLRGIVKETVIPKAQTEHQRSLAALRVSPLDVCVTAVTKRWSLGYRRDTGGALGTQCQIHSKLSLEIKVVKVGKFKTC